MTISKLLQCRKTAALGAAFLTVAWALSPAAADTIIYDDFEKPGGYSLADYSAKWVNPYGLGEMAISDTRNFAAGNFAISAKTFQTGFDYSVYDHLKYIGVSTQAFAVPTVGSITFSSVIDATTYRTQPGRIIEGTYIESGKSYAAPALEGQQAAAVMNMIDFQTGQLFDWFVSGDTAFTLIERLPSAVTNPSLLPGDPGFVGMDKMYTQIINEVKIGAGPQNVSISYSRQDGVSFFLNGALISHVTNVGIPLDVQGLPYSGIYPSYGPGENLLPAINSFSIGHGLFSLLDAFPFQHPDRPDLAVSIPVANRIFGQGIDATFDDFKVTTGQGFTVPPAGVPEPASWVMLIAGFTFAGTAMRRRSAGLRFV